MGRDAPRARSRHHVLGCPTVVLALLARAARASSLVVGGGVVRGRRRRGCRSPDNWAKLQPEHVAGRQEPVAAQAPVVPVGARHHHRHRVGHRADGVRRGVDAGRPGRHQAAGGDEHHRPQRQAAGRLGHRAAGVRHHLRADPEATWTGSARSATSVVRIVPMRVFPTEARYLDRMQSRARLEPATNGLPRGRSRRSRSASRRARLCMPGSPPSSMPSTNTRNVAAPRAQDQSRLRQTDREQCDTKE